MPVPSLGVQSHAPHAPSPSEAGSEEATRLRLRELLRRVFGHDAFRPHQEQVCASIVRGNNALLVMPTGAGKSLCYQLPGLALGGPTLVVSPLIALMDDQVNKLVALGLRAAAIHSGKQRMESRAACVDYAAGKLNFLFIAPERLGLPRFAEFLSKYRPRLIAIDEAHCISHWGHDFRPDYRLLQQRLPQLMPCPVVALTATATEKVQADIIAQLGVHPVERHVFGFRRHNLAIETAEVTTSQRPKIIETLLADPARRPAIVYAPTRKEAEKQAEALRALRARAYHAGMDAGERERISSSFLRGEIDTIVATVAFGMGIDKPDVRTVIHSALPGSIESYYQEIGRAGRDGKPSRAILLHSFADVRTHLWFLDRDYPPLEELQQVFAMLSAAPKTREQLAAGCELPPDQVDRALEKVLVHGGAQLVRGDGDTFVRASALFTRDYLAQRDHKRAQLSSMSDFTGAGRCRMLQLVRHFGDQEDSGALCGQCDLCNPGQALCSQASALAPSDVVALKQVLTELRERDAQAVGKLFRDNFEARMERRDFQTLLSYLERAGWIELQEDQFEKDHQTVRYQRALLTQAGRDVTPSEIEGLRTLKPAAKLRAGKRRGKADGEPSTRARSSKAPPGVPAAGDERLVRQLRDWRRAIAEERQTPAFTIMSDRTLHAIASERPSNLDELHAVHGVGKTFISKYGATVLSLIRDY